MTTYTQPLSGSTDQRGTTMRQPEEVAQMLALHSLGWRTRKIAAELKISRHTVRKYLEQQEWLPYGKPKRASALDSLEEWLKEKFLKHRGNAEVVRQELVKEHQIKVSLRTVERAVAPFRQLLRAANKATVRFETPPGKQLQIDFGSTHVFIANERTRICLFVATLGYSRRLFVLPLRHERQSAWFKGLEETFQHFGGIPEEVLLDNPRALVTSHNPLTREVVFNERFRAFASYWKFRPKACAPYRARTKGKDERSVSYVKSNGIAGREFSSWGDLEKHLSTWLTYADQRIHGTTQEKPIERFLAAEAQVLKPLEGRPPFLMIRECTRTVQADACIEIETNRYSVPWGHIGRQVTVQVIDSEVRIFYGQEEIAKHGKSLGRRTSRIHAQHLEGIVGASSIKTSELLRPLEEYEAAIGGGA